MLMCHDYCTGVSVGDCHFDDLESSRDTLIVLSEVTILK